MGLEARKTALAYDLGAHASFHVIGLGVNIYGIVGSKKTNLSAVVISGEFGWFGDRKRRP